MSLLDVDRRLLEQAHARRDAAAAMHEDGVAVRLGARDVFERDVAARAGAVLDDDVLAGERPHLLGEVAHQHVGAGARRERADEVDVLRRILLRLRAGRQRQHGRQAAAGMAARSSHE